VADGARPASSRLPFLVLLALKPALEAQAVPMLLALLLALAACHPILRTLPRLGEQPTIARGK